MCNYAEVSIMSTGIYIIDVALFVAELAIVMGAIMLVSFWIYDHFDK